MIHNADFHKLFFRLSLLISRFNALDVTVLILMPIAIHVGVRVDINQVCLECCTIATTILKGLLRRSMLPLLTRSTAK